MSNTKKSIILCVLSALFLVIVSGLYAYGFIWIKNTNEYTSSLAGQLSTESQKKENERRLAQAIKDTDEGRTKLNSYFVTGDDSVKFLETIEDYGDIANTQVKFTTVDYDAVKNELTMTLKITGGFEDVYQNIVLLENAPYEFEFKRIILSHSTGQVADPTKKIIAKSVWDADINFILKSVGPKK